MWHSSVQPSIIGLFELVHLNDLLVDELVDEVVKEVDIKDVLKSSIFVVQKAAAPKNGVEFRQGSIGAIRSSLAMSYDALRRRATQSRKRLLVAKTRLVPTGDWQRP